MSRRSGRVAVAVASAVAALLITSGCSAPGGDETLPGIDLANTEAAPRVERFPVAAPDPQEDPGGPTPASPVAVGETTPAPGATDDPASGPAPGAAPATATAPNGTTGGQSIGQPTGRRAPQSPVPPPALGHEPEAVPQSRTSTPRSTGPKAAPGPSTSPTNGSTTEPVAAVPIDPQVTVDVQERVQEVIAIPAPQAVAAAGGAVWVKRDDGMLDRIDPATNQVVASIQAATSDPTCSGLGGVGNILWTCVGGGSVARIDPTTNTVVARLDLNKLAGQRRIPMAFDHSWFLVDGGVRLVSVDHATNSVDATVELNTTCAGVDATDTAVWLACPGTGVVLRVDPSARAVTHMVEGLPGARSITAGGYVWVGYDGGTARIDRSTAMVTGAVDTGPDTSRRSLYTAGNLVYIRTPEAFLQVLDATTLQLIEQVSTPDLTNGSALLAFGSVWTTAGEGGSLYRLAKPATS